ncbi:hypothetical protein BDZ97DRAFT_1053743 [Flammula alnicola]|nr:hypothetical protein BDZ97DRAFT_1053743 [Flammula alnicola]
MNSSSSTLRRPPLGIPKSSHLPSGFTYYPPTPQSPIFDFDSRELATVVRGTISNNVAEIAASFILQMNLSGQQFMKFKDKELETLSNNDPTVFKELKSLQTSPPSSLMALLTPNPRSPSIAGSFTELESVIRGMRTGGDQEISSSPLTIRDSDEPFDFDDDDDTLSEDGNPAHNLGAMSGEGETSASCRNDTPLPEATAHLESNTQPSSLPSSQPEEKVPPMENSHHSMNADLLVQYQGVVGVKTDAVSLDGDLLKAQTSTSSSTESFSRNLPFDPDREAALADAVVADEQNLAHGNTGLENISTNPYFIPSSLPNISLLDRDETRHIMDLETPAASEGLDRSGDRDDHEAAQSHDEPYNGDQQSADSHIELQRPLSPDGFGYGSSFSHIADDPEDEHLNRTGSSDPSTHSQPEIVTTPQFYQLSLAVPISIPNPSFETSTKDQVPADDNNLVEDDETTFSGSEVGALPQRVSDVDEMPDTQGNDLKLGPLSPLLVNLSPEYQDGRQGDVVVITAKSQSSSPAEAMNLDRISDATSSFLVPGSPSTNIPGQQTVELAQPHDLTQSRGSESTPSNVQHGADSSLTGTNEDVMFSDSMLIFIEQPYPRDLADNQRSAYHHGAYIHDVDGGNAASSAVRVRDSDAVFHPEVSSLIHRDRDLSIIASTSNADNLQGDRSPILALPAGKDGDLGEIEFSTTSLERDIPSFVPTHTLEGSTSETAFSPLSADKLILQTGPNRGPIKSSTEFEPLDLPPSSGLPSPCPVASSALTPLNTAVPSHSLCSASATSSQSPRLLLIPDTSPFTMGNWSDANGKTLLAFMESPYNNRASPGTCAQSVSSPQNRSALLQNSTGHILQSDNPIISPSRSIVILGEDELLMLPDVQRHEPPVFRNSPLSDIGTQLDRDSLSPCPSADALLFLPLSNSGSGSPMTKVEPRIFGADIENNSAISVSSILEQSSHHILDNFGAKSGPLSQQTPSVRETVTIGPTLGIAHAPRHDNAVDLDVDERLNVEPTSAWRETHDVQQDFTAGLSYAMQLPSLAVSPTDWSLSQEIASCLPCDNPGSSCHVVADASPMSKASFSPSRLSRDTPRTLWPTAEFLHNMAQASAFPRRSKSLGTCGTSDPAPESPLKPSRVTYTDVAVQTDLESQRKLSEIQTRGRVSNGDAGATTLSALLPVKGSLIGMMQTFAAQVFRRESSDDAFPYPVSPPQPRIQITPGAMLLSPQGPISALSNDGDG